MSSNSAVARSPLAAPQPGHATESMMHGSPWLLEASQSAALIVNA